MQYLKFLNPTIIEYHPHEMNEIFGRNHSSISSVEALCHSPRNLSKEGPRPATRTGIFGPHAHIANTIPDQRHCIIKERRQHDFSDFPRICRRTVRPQNLEIDQGSADMQALVG
ncbi:hypothetical protein DPPLL_35070 [Desulfofustis limnaeus]|uniref:Uncharacterized protein n=1 Tax=Desulfofustis limnaeus TaxID=2740163 RepID=A0ABM7WDS9_9BACT|nr:hypothetical protein DPPLL_35070 [Desulfofustis limnaeus]